MPVKGNIEPNFKRTKKEENNKVKQFHVENQSFTHVYWVPGSGETGEQRTLFSGS